MRFIRARPPQLAEWLLKRMTHYEEAFSCSDDLREQYARIAAVNPSFFFMFTFPFVTGDPVSALEKPHTIAFTESAATFVVMKARFTCSIG